MKLCLTLGLATIVALRTGTEAAIAATLAYVGPEA
jgi:hypothetical protein